VCACVRAYVRVIFANYQMLPALRPFHIFLHCIINYIRQTKRLVFIHPVAFLFNYVIVVSLLRILNSQSSLSSSNTGCRTFGASFITRFTFLDLGLLLRLSP